jgi:hypothetical protein
LLLTCDQNLRYQQNLTGRRLAIVILSTNHWPSLAAGGSPDCRRHRLRSARSGRQGGDRGNLVAAPARASWHKSMAKAGPFFGEGDHSSSMLDLLKQCVAGAEAPAVGPRASRAAPVRLAPLPLRLPAG